MRSSCPASFSSNPSPARGLHVHSDSPICYVISNRAHEIVTIPFMGVCLDDEFESPLVIRV
jgi:hypothetical protein